MPHKGVEIDDLQIELLFNAQSWNAGETLDQIQFATHGISFLSNSNLIYVPHPVPYGNLLKKSTLLAENVICFSTMEKDEALYYVLVLHSGDLAICVLEEIWDITVQATKSPFLLNKVPKDRKKSASSQTLGSKWNNEDFANKSSLKLRLLHPVTNMSDLGVTLWENILPTLTFVSDMNYIVMGQRDVVTIFRYDAESAQDDQSITVICNEVSMENPWIRKLLPATSDDSALSGIWKHSSGAVTLVTRLGYSHQLSFFSLFSLAELHTKPYLDTSKTTHRSQISAISTSPSTYCDYALTGDINGCVLLWKYYFQSENDLHRSQHHGTAEDNAASHIYGKWEVVLEETLFCENQRVTLLHIDPRNLYAYMGDTSGRLSIAQISMKSNHMHLIHDLNLYPISHGPTSVFIIPTSSLPSSSSAYIYGDHQSSASSKKNENSVLVQCYSASTQEALQVHVTKGIASIMRISAASIVPCDRGNEKLRSERPDGHTVFPVQDTAPFGNKIIDRSIVLSSLNMIVTVDWLGIVQLWDVFTGQLQQQLVLPTHHITCLAGNDGICWKKHHRVMLCSGHRSGIIHTISLSLETHGIAPLSSNESIASEHKDAKDPHAPPTEVGKSDLPVFDLLQEDSEEDEEEDEESALASHDKDGQSKLGIGEDELADLSRSLAEGSVGSVGLDSLSLSQISLLGNRRQGGIHATNSLPLQCKIEQAMCPNHLPATDVFWSDFGDHLVTVHGQKVIHLFQTQADSSSISSDTKKPKSQERPVSEKKSSAGSSRPVSKDAKSAAAASTGRPPQGKKSSAESTKSDKANIKGGMERTIINNSEEDGFSVNSSLSGQAGPNNISSTASKRLTQSLVLPFTPLHITVLQRQPEDIHSKDAASHAKAAARRASTGDNKADDDQSDADERTQASDDKEKEDRKAFKEQDRLWLVLQKAQDTILIFDALKMEFMTEVKLSPVGQDVKLSVTLVWDYVDRATLQCVLMGLCAHSIDDWFEFNEVDGLKAVANQAGNQGGSFHQSTYSHLQQQSATETDEPNDKATHSSLNASHLSSHMISSMPSSMISQVPLSILESEILGVESYRMGEAPIVVGWSHKSCVLLRLQLLEGNRVTVTRFKKFNLNGTGLLQHVKRNRAHVLTGKALNSSEQIRNHRVVVVLSNGFAVVLHL